MWGIDQCDLELWRTMETRHRLGQAAILKDGHGLAGIETTVLYKASQRPDNDAVGEAYLSCTP